MNNDFSQNLPTEESFRAKRRHPTCSSRVISKPCKVFVVVVCAIIAIAIIGIFIAAAL